MLERLETWLVAHAPVTHAGLCPPAGADLLQALGDPETAMLYAWHNGSRGSFQLAPQLEFTPLELGSRPGWDPAWLPIATDGCGGFLVADRESLRVFRAANEYLPYVCLLAGSVTELVADVVTALESGSTLHGSSPVVEHGELDWVPTPEAAEFRYDFKII
ncbi:hypothetical protein [Lentzea californiensis]|uniref:hypothetical protein n=1 Tax=Lentzea californiensis TaxID=438851 RepID=UPI00216604FB|nr:hypothetical protein [Lentzea californiensis]MCR3754413.1 hypothetical protein [Lentzea californiensis]